MTEPKLSVQNLTFRYARATNPTLEGLTLTVWPNEVVLLLGPSGCGKTTLGLCLNGVIPRLIQGEITGVINLDGRNLNQAEPPERSRQIGMVFQDPETQFCTLYVQDEVAFPLENLCVSPETMRPKITAALETVGLGGFEPRVVYRLSGGEKQRVALASILALDAEVLFLDAATANLDPQGTRQVFDIIRRFKGEKTIIVVEQKVDHLVDFVDRLLLMDERGRIFAEGPPAEVFSSVSPDILDTMGVWYPQTVEVYYSLPIERRPSHMPADIEGAAEALRKTKSLANAALVPNNQLSGMHQIEDAPQKHQEYQHKTAFEVRDLDYAYPDGKRALVHANLIVPSGSFFALVGQNGSGKTTLVQHLIGIRRPPAGHVFLFGKDISRLTVRDIASHVGYVFQNPEHQFVARTVEDELAYSLNTVGVAGEPIATQVRIMLNSLGLTDFATQNPHTLSAGEMRRLSVATMLISGPEILILDEPTFGQDRKNSLTIMGILRDLCNAGKTILMVTHDMRLVAEYADHVAVMSRAATIFQGQPASLFTQASVLGSAALEQPPVWQLAVSAGLGEGVLTVDDLVRRLLFRDETAS